ncbi:hypothetical protein QX995_002171 [Vibrio vulnificus]|nr:hypothetical protein [Vibrio vulnificus]
MKGTLQYYNIDKLGIYKRGSDEQLFDSSEAVLDSLIDWFKARPNLVNTSTRKADKAQGQSNVYCCDADGANGEYVFVLWNELTNAEDEILTLSKDSKPGAAKVKSGVDSKTAIPGLPSYYWISLNHDLIATIHFDHAMTSLGALRNYITSYVQNYSEFAVTHKDNEDKVIGYRHPDEEGPVGYFKFDLKRKTDESTVEELTQKFNRITKVVRRTEKAVEEVELKGFFHNLASKQIKRGLPQNREVYVEVEIEFTPSSEQDFKEIVKAYEREIIDPDKFNNLGFVLKGGGGKKVFLDGKFMKTEHEFEIQRNKRNPFEAGELLEYIGRKQIRLVPRKKVKEAA